MNQQNKSFIAKIEEFILMKTKPEYMDSQEKVDQFLLERSNISEQEVKSSLFKSKDIDGTQIFTFGDENSENIVMFIHGGAYINEINMQHFLFCYILAHQANAYVIAPVYPLTPNHTYKESFEIITGLYKKILKTEKAITMMGDSAGGGFVHSFCQYLNTVDLTQPNHIITFSPWVDISMDNIPDNISENDPILGKIGLKEIGKAWAGDLDTKNYKVSPLYGDNENLAKTLIFAGDNEIFYKDIVKYVEKLKDDGVDVRLITGKGLFHIYPLFPMPEMRGALKEIKKEILL